MRGFTFLSGTAVGALAAATVLFVPRLWPDDGCHRDGILTVMGGKDVSSGQERRALIEGWKHPNLKTELRELSGVADLQYSQLVAAAQDGGCDADIYILDLPWITEFADAGYLSPIQEGSFDKLKKQEPLKDVLTGELQQSGYRDGKLWAAPFNADAPLLYYRKDLLEKAHLKPPQSWTELVQQATTLLNEPDNGLQAGYAAQLAPYEGFTVNALELIWAHIDRPITNDDGDVDIHPSSVPTLRDELTANMSNDRSTVRTLIDRRSLTWHEDESIEAFSSGRTLFMRNWPTAYRRLAEDPAVTDPDQLAAKYGVALLPGRGVLGGQSLAIAANSPYRAEAKQLIQELTGQGAQHRLFWCGGFASVRTDVYAEQGKDECAGGPTKPGKRVVRHLPWADVPLLRQAIKTARPRPTNAHYTEFSRVFQELLSCRLQEPSEPPDCDAEAKATPDFTRYFEKRLTSALHGG